MALLPLPESQQTVLYFWKVVQWWNEIRQFVLLIEFLRDRRLQKSTLVFFGHSTTILCKTTTLISTSKSPTKTHLRVETRPTKKGRVLIFWIETWLAQKAQPYNSTELSRLLNSSLTKSKGLNSPNIVLINRLHLYKSNQYYFMALCFLHKTFERPKFQNKQINSYPFRFENSPLSLTTAMIHCFKVPTEWFKSFKTRSKFCSGMIIILSEFTETEVFKTFLLSRLSRHLNS